MFLSQKAIKPFKDSQNQSKKRFIIIVILCEGGPRPGMMGGPRPGMGGPRPGMRQPEEPPSKKQKTEENLIPENEFMAKNKSPVTFRVRRRCVMCIVFSFSDVLPFLYPYIMLLPRARLPKRRIAYVTRQNRWLSHETIFRALKRRVYIFAFGAFNSKKQVNVGGIQISLCNSRP